MAGEPFMGDEFTHSGPSKAQSTALLTALIDENPLAIVVLDSQGRVSLCNRAFQALFLYREDEVLGRDLDTLVAAEPEQEEARGITKRILTGESVRLATRRRRKDGVGVDVEIHGVPLFVEGELTGTFGIYQDITERIRWEEGTRENEERFRRLAAATFEGIVVLDSEKIVDCNEQYARMVGATTPTDLVGRPVYDFVAPEDHELVRERISSEYERPYEHRLRKVDGTMLPVEVHGKAIRYQGRRMRVTAVRDVAHQRRLEEEVRQSQKMEAIGRLAGGIAHDFNNLLTIILGHCSLLARKIPEGSEFLGSITEIRRAAEHATLMTGRLLAFGHKQSVKPQIVDLNLALKGMERVLRRLMRADIDLVINADPSIGKVRCDPGQLEQVILNLAINAGDAMPGGGMLTLETSSLDLDDTAPHESLAGVAPPWVLLTVSDTGIGMDGATLERLFEPFFTTKKRGKGTGLGLSTVYAIVKQSGGNILVDSRPGHGTTFRIFFPQVGEMDDTTAAVPDSADAGQGSETVLVVEDEPGVRQLTIDFLKLHGYRVLQAEDGVAGLETVRRSGEEIQLILTDVVMPRMNGPDMVEHVALSHPDIKVLFMSGYDDGVLNRRDAFARFRMVQKPFSMKELVGTVREVLDGSTRPSSGSFAS